MDSDGAYGIPDNAPSDSIWAALSSAQQAAILPARAVHPTDAANFLYGAVLEMGYLTNFVPVGLCSDFSQSSGTYSQEGGVAGNAFNAANEFADTDGDTAQFCAPSNGIPAAAFRRKMEIPILLQHGESCSMRLNLQRAIPMLPIALGGAGWLEVRIDWWATESFVEKS